MQGKLLPQALQLEEAVLSACLQIKHAADEVIGMLDVSDFYKPSHIEIYDAIQVLNQEGSPVDMLTVSEKVRSLGHKVPLTEVVALTAKVPASTSLEEYCRIIKQKSIRRQVITDGHRLAQEAFDDTIDVFEMLDKTDLLVSDIKAGIMKSRRSSKASIIERMLKKVETSAFDTFTGIHELDQSIFAAEPGDLILIAGRPGMGKSVMANTIASHWSFSKKKKVFFWGLEMTNEQNMMRFVSNVGQIDFQTLREGQSKFEKLEKVTQDIIKAPIEFEDISGINALEIRSRLISQKKRHGLDIAIIDHGGLMTNIDAKDPNLVRQISKTSMLMKQTAKDLDIPIVMLWQLSREVEKRPMKKPQLSDLRDSGSLEQDADKVIFLYRPEYYNFDRYISTRGDEYDTSGLAAAIIAKNRNGTLGEKLMSFVPEFMRFDNFGGYMKTVDEIPERYRDEDLF